MVGLGGGAAAKFKPFQNMVILHIKFKLTKQVASILPTDTPLTRGGGGGGGGQNVKPYIFCERSHVAISN